MAKENPELYTHLFTNTMSTDVATLLNQTDTSAKRCTRIAAAAVLSVELMVMADILLSYEEKVVSWVGQ